MDVTVAARIEPESVDAVLAGCTHDERIRIIENLEATPSDQHMKDPKKITGSTYKIELEGLAQQMVTMIAEGTAEAAPPASERRVAGEAKNKRERTQKMNGNHYLNARERELLAEGMFFGGWEDAERQRVVLEPLERFDRPALHTAKMGQPEWVPEELMRMQLRKAMAGAPRSELVDTGRIEKSAAERAARAQAATVRRRDGRELQSLGDAPTVHRVGPLDLRTRAGRDEDIRGSALLVAVAQPLGRRPRATPAGTAAAVTVEGRMAGATAAGAHETVCLDDGRIYQGEGLNRRPHGLVKLTWPSGGMYRGTRVHGTRHGNGTCRDVEGGGLRRGVPQRRALGPQSQCPWPNDRVYEGACRAGMRHGEAVETIPRGASRRCTGQWVEDIRESRSPAG